MDLEAEFARVAAAYGAPQETVQRWWEELAARYGEPGRHYHTLAHVAEMLALLAHESETLLAAVWFHDAVYAADAAEERSALIARGALEELSFPAEEIGIVQTLILATKTHDPASVAPRYHCFLDADLAIFGSDRARYRQYVDQVRQEYVDVPDEVFTAGRAAILRRLIERPRIYSTDHFVARFEDRARANVEWELSGWSPSR